MHRLFGRGPDAVERLYNAAICVGQLTYNLGENVLNFWERAVGDE